MGTFLEECFNYFCENENKIEFIKGNEIYIDSQTRNEFSKRETGSKILTNNLNEEMKRLKEPVLVGLNNIQLLSYINAILRCLSNTKKLTKYFLENYKYDENKKLSNEYYKVISNLWNQENNNISFTPNSFKEVLFSENKNAQNNCKDLINFLFERLHQELNNININANNNFQIAPDRVNELSMLNHFLKDFRENYNSPISNLFYGILRTKSHCFGCNAISYDFRYFSFLEFPLEKVIKYNKNMRKMLPISENEENPKIDLYEFFEYLQIDNQMTDDNKKLCLVCNKLSDETFTINLYSCPRYLIINLNRGKENKYQCTVNFPEQLDLYNYIIYKEGITMYELYGVICQLPNSIDGHFVAFCKNINNHEWYLYDDSNVILCTRPKQYLDGIPFMLFYKAANEETK